MLKVLIADDEVKVSQLILHLVRWEDFDMEVLDTVNDGETAYKIIQDKKPDIVITDIRMPGMDGIELVEQTMKLTKDIFFVIISGYSQFEYAQQAVKLGVEDYLLKPIKKKELEAVLNKILNKHNVTVNKQEEREELICGLQDMKEKIKNNFLSELMDNHNLSVLELESGELQKRYECSFSSEYFTHIILHLFTRNVTENNEEYGFILPKLQKNLKTKLEGCGSEIMSILHNEEIICLVNTVGCEKDELIHCLYKLKMDVSNIRAIFPGFKVIIGVGKTVVGLKNYPASIGSAQDAIRNRFGKEERFVSVYEDIGKQKMEISELFTSADKKGMLTAMELVDIPAFSGKIKEIRKKLAGKRENGQIVYEGYREIVDTFLFGIKSYFNCDIKIEHKTMMKGYQCLYCFDDIFNWLEETCCAFLVKIEESQRSQEAKPIRLAKQYINENYNSMISLENVSSYIGFNPAYFSSMFKKATGQNFMEYVIEVRINNAKDQLVQTGDDVAEIAAKVGYSDLKYFSRIFKKLTNLTPSEYRRLYS